MKHRSSTAGSAIVGNNVGKKQSLKNFEWKERNTIAATELSELKVSDPPKVSIIDPTLSELKKPSKSERKFKKSQNTDAYKSEIVRSSTSDSKTKSHKSTKDLKAYSSDGMVANDAPQSPDQDQTELSHFQHTQPGKKARLQSMIGVSKALRPDQQAASPKFILVRLEKRERSTSADVENYFEFCWQQNILFDEDMVDIQDACLVVTSLDFHEKTSVC